MSEPHDDMTRYQPVRIHGRDVGEGERESASRYRVVRRIVAEKVPEPFTVADLGANLGYFALRLTEDFDCRVTCVEHGRVARRLRQVLSRNTATRIDVHEREVTVDDLEEWPRSYDVVLAMAVVHHIGGGWPRLLDALRSLGTHLIMEFPTEPTACGQHMVRQIRVPGDGWVAGRVTGQGGRTRPVVYVG